MVKRKFDSMVDLDPRVRGFLEGNRWAGSKEYVKPLPFVEMQKKGRERGDGSVIVVACTDPRVRPEEFLGLDASNQPTMIRTAGGRVHSALPTLLVLAAVGNAGKKGTIMIIHHTDCGLQTITDEEIRGVMEDSVGGLREGDTMESMYERMEAVGVLEGLEFGGFERPEDSVKEDVETLRESPFFKGMQIVGFVLNTETGILGEIEIE